MNVYDITVLGLVQGIGYRSFVAEYAKEHGLLGYVRNSGGIIKIHVECEPEEIGKFTFHLRYNCPKGGRIDNIIVKPVKQPEETKIEESEVPGGDEPQNSDAKDVDVLDAYGAEYDDSFIIAPSESFEEKMRFISPDIATCPDCEKELLDPNNRRYRYPFISCKKCGPRISIIKTIPYDRESITMKGFSMCPNCEAEYHQIGNPRHLAQTIGCKDCGPMLRYYENRMVDEIQLSQEEMIQKTEEALKNGKIGAIKCVGGFRMVCLPICGEALKKLRRIKGRPGKPFSILFPDMETIRKYCRVSEKEEELLKSPARPVVLLEKKYEYAYAEWYKESILSGEIESIYSVDELFDYETTRFSDRIGVMLPADPLQIILSKDLGPIVISGGNKSGESVITDDKTMRMLLPEIDETDEDIFDEDKKEEEDTNVEASEPEETLDFMLTNTREILDPLEDSLVQVTKVKSGHRIKDVVQFIRRSRGYVPEPIEIPNVMELDSFASGSDMKSVFALGKKNMVYLSEYFGDLDNSSAPERRSDEIDRMCELFNISPKRFVTDLNPGYESVEDAERRAKIDTEEDDDSVVFLKRQHHTAHILSVVAEHGLKGRLLGLAFDGNGYGMDGTVWGSEIFSCLLNTIADENSIDPEKTVEIRPHILRSGALLPVRLLGNKYGAKDAKTTLCCYLRAAEERQLISITNLDRILERIGVSRADYGVICACLKAELNTYYSSSMGRLFDAVAALLGIAYENTYDGQCAIELETAAYRAQMNLEDAVEKFSYKILEPRDDNEIYRFDQTLFVADILERFIKLIDSIDPEDETALSKGRDILALRFHEAIAKSLVEVCDVICSRDYIQHIALSGGTMYNRILLQNVVGPLEELGYTVYLNSKVPCGDAGIALGQIYPLLENQDD